jgi:hypothetical protein
MINPLRRFFKNIAPNVEGLAYERPQKPENYYGLAEFIWARLNINKLNEKELKALTFRTGTEDESWTLVEQLASERYQAKSLAKPYRPRTQSRVALDPAYF